MRNFSTLDNKVKKKLLLILLLHIRVRVDVNFIHSYTPKVIMGNVKTTPAVTNVYLNVNLGQTLFVQFKPTNAQKLHLIQKNI
jgi:hypothetical protein